MSFKSLEDNIGKVLKPIFSKSFNGKSRKTDFLIILNLQQNWHKIVGEQCFKFCEPKKIKFARNKKSDALLVISAFNSATAFYLEASLSQIIENIACLYGYKIISNIKIIQEPKFLNQKTEEDLTEISEEEQKFIENSTAIIKNPDLKETLNKLGKLIIKNHE